jgi:hypothetical protein
MPKQRLAIAHSIAQRLYAAEEALDLAAARIAELNAALPLARLDGRLAASIGQDAFRTSADAVVLVARTRDKIVITHDMLKQVSDDIGLGPQSYGDVFKVAENRQSVTDVHRLAA